MTPARALAPQGVRAKLKVAFERGAHYSTIAALSVRNVHAPFTIEGAFGYEVFELSVEKMLVPELRQGDWVALDNASFYYSVGAIRLIEAPRQASCIFRFNNWISIRLKNAFQRSKLICVLRRRVPNGSYTWY